MMVDFIYHSDCNGTCNAIGRSYNPFLPLKWIVLIQDKQCPGVLDQRTFQPKCGCSSVARASRCQRECRGFESHHPLFAPEHVSGFSTTRGLIDSAVFLMRPKFRSETVFSPGLHPRYPPCLATCILKISNRNLQSEYRHNQ